MNRFGKLFSISTFGESHGVAIGVIIDGCPAGLEITKEDIQNDLDRRRPGQSEITTQRKEKDRVQILSGIFNNKTLGTPIALLIPNEDAKSKDYSHIESVFRPNHADYTYEVKYGHRDYRGGGRSSARETVARVAAGAIARKYLNHNKINIFAYVSQIGSLKLDKTFKQIDPLQIDTNIVRCPDQELAIQMINLIKDVRAKGDTLGGLIECVIKGSPVGLGEPVFNKLHADLGAAMLGINAVQGFEYGSGFAGAQKLGSENNDIFEERDSKVRTQTNHSGGIQGGISNGEDIYFRVAFKPVATIMQDQNSINLEGEKVLLKAKGRHDPCVVPRAVPIIEAMAALIIADHLLLSRSNKI